MKYQSIKKNNLIEYKKPVFIIGENKILKKYNIPELSKYITIGFNNIYYSGFSPTFICINDIKILSDYPFNEIFGCDHSKYILSKDIYKKYKNKLIEYNIDFHRLCLLEENKHSNYEEDDTTFKTYIKSYSVLSDFALPLLNFLGVTSIHFLGFDSRTLYNLLYQNCFMIETENINEINIYISDINKYKHINFTSDNNHIYFFPFYKNIFLIEKYNNKKYLKNKILITNFFLKPMYFMIVNANIENDDCISLLSMNNNLSYIRIYHNRVRIEKVLTDTLYNKQTSIYYENNNGKYYFRSHLYPQKVLYHNEKTTNIVKQEYYKNILNIEYNLYDVTDIYKLIDFTINNTTETFILISHFNTVSLKNLKYPTNHLIIYYTKPIVAPIINNTKYSYDSSFYLHELEDNYYSFETTKNGGYYLSYDKNNKLICSDIKGKFRFNST